MPPDKVSDPAETEERMRSVVNHIVDGIITFDESGAVATFNPAAERIFGYAAADLIGRNVNLLMPAPYRRDHDGYIRNYLESGQASIIGIGRQVVGQRSDGSTFPMELAISVFRIGEQRFFTAIVRDITERRHAEQELREAEERMRSVVDHVIDGIITIDEAGDVESFNPAAEKLFGYDKSEIIGRNVRVLMPEPYHDEHDRYIGNFVRTGEAKVIGIGRQVVGRRKDGSVFPMELAVSAFHLGARRYFTGIIRDVTERTRLEQELHQRLQELAEADLQKNEFLAMLGHELRNPLAPLLNALHLIKLAGSDPIRTRNVHAMMERQVQHLVRLVDDLLDISRIIRGHIELRKEPVELASVFARAVETAEPVIDAHAHELHVSLPEQKIFVEADIIRLAQVISNLLTNAAKYTDKAGKIWLTAARDDGDVVLSVRDSGIGISPEFLPRIFDVFVQGDHSLARSQGGLGLGLTLVRRLVEMHGGTVDVTSDGEGHGSMFTIRLPALPTSPHPVAEKGGVLEPLPPAQRRKPRILIVDDNVDAAESMGMLLELAGFETRCAFDGPAAIDAAKKFHPELILLDIGLPGISGYDVAAQLRSEPGFEHTRLVAVTGYGREDDRRRSKEAGFDHHLTKPVDPGTLTAFVARVTSENSAADD